MTIGTSLTVLGEYPYPYGSDKNNRSLVFLRDTTGSLIVEIQSLFPQKQTLSTVTASHIFVDARSPKERMEESIAQAFSESPKYKKPASLQDFSPNRQEEIIREITKNLWLISMNNQHKIGSYGPEDITSIFIFKN